MAIGKRSPFGELVYRYRTRLGLRQIDLASRTRELAQEDRVPAPVSERTIAGIERSNIDPRRWRSPRLATVTTLAVALGLKPGTDEFEAFLASATTPPDGKGSPNGLQSPEFIAEGRETHLARLREVIDTSVSGSAGAVFVSADPGTGKSWLIQEACRQALVRHAELVVLWTQCTSRFGTGPSHEPFRTMLRLMVGDITMKSDRERVSDANVERLCTRIPDAVRALIAHGGPFIDGVLPAESLGNERLVETVDSQLRTDLDVAIQHQARRDHRGQSIEDALYRVLFRYAGAGPVVLVLEDLHWADPGTLAALAHLLTRLFRQRLPVVLIGSFRPGEVAEVTDAGYTLQSVLRMTPRLYPDAVLDLSTAVGGDPGRAFVDAVVARSSVSDPTSLAEPIFWRTAGLPLFVVSILRLYEQEHQRGGESTESTREMPIPEAVQAVFAEQVQRLPEEVQRLLDAASVQGAEFAAEPLMRMFGLSPTQFIDMVDSRLVRQFRMLLPGSVVTISGQPQHRYQFSHVLLRDYLHSKLNDLERQHYHLRTAEALLDLYGPGAHESSEAIAFHLSHGGDRLRAARAYIDAGDHALVRRDFERARAHYERVSQLDIRHENPSLYIFSRIGLGNAARREGNLEQAREQLEQALELAERYDLPMVKGHALESLGIVDMDAGEIKVGVDRLRRVIDLWVDADKQNAARAMANLSYLLYGLGRYEEGIGYAERAREIATRLGDQRLWLDAQVAMANCWIDLGLYEDALVAYRHGLDVCGQLGDTHREHLCLLNIALISLESCDWDACVSALQKVLDTPGGPVIHIVGYAEFDLGVVAEARADLPAARAHYERSRQIRESIGQNALVIDSLAGLLRVAVAEQNRDEIGRLLEDVEDRVNQHGLDGVEHVGRLFLSIMDAHKALDDAERARAALDRAVEFLENRAAGIVDPDHRTSYLTSPPSHRRILKLAGHDAPGSDR